MSEQSKGLVVRELSPSVWEMITNIAQSAHQSHVLGTTSEHDAAMRMLTGYELGLPLTASLRAIYLVNGKPAIQPKALWGLIVRHPEFAGLEEQRLTDGNGRFTGWSITLKRKNGLEATRQFTLADATRAGLNNKPNWQGYPEHTCYWRALAAVEDVVFPDVVMGLYRADEMGAAITPEGEVIEGQWSAASAQGSDTPVDPGKAVHPQFGGVALLNDDETAFGVPTLDELVSQYGADRVMAVNDGQIPTSTADRAKVAAILKEQNQ